VIHDVPTNAWDLELEELFLRTGARFTRVEPRRRMRDYVRGLLGPVGRKNSWQLAEYAGHDIPHGLQHLLSHSRWDTDGLRDDLQAYVAEQLGRPDGVLILDDTGFVKKGTTSAGVQRQYSGTAGRTENCQIGVFAAYATTRGHALVDRERYLPQSWTQGRERCRAARIPDERTFATKGDLARDMIRRALDSPLPIVWGTADSAYGQDSRFRRFLEDTQLAYVVAVPKTQQVNGPRIDHLIAQAPPEAWQRLSAGPRANGSTTGPPPACPQRPNPTVTSRPGSGGYWPAAASAGPTRSPTTSPAPRWRPPSPTWSVLPAAVGRSRSASRARRTSAAWTSTRSAATWAGTATSRSPCSPTPSSP